MTTERVTITTQDGQFRATIYVRGRYGDTATMAAVARVRERAFAITGSFAVACWHDDRSWRAGAPRAA